MFSNLHFISFSFIMHCIDVIVPLSVCVEEAMAAEKRFDPFKATTNLFLNLTLYP